MKKLIITKWISLILVLILVATACLLSGCGQQQDSEGDSIDVSDENQASNDSDYSKEELGNQESENSFEEKGEDGHTHDMSEVSRVDATYESEGVIIYKCTKCDYEKTSTVAKLSHSYSLDWSYDEEYHWRKCNDKGYDDLKSDNAAHNFKAGETTNATYDSAEYTEYLCDCGYSKQVKTGEALSHSFSSEWSFDSVSHWHKCIDKGYENVKADEEAHVDSNEVIIQATTDNRAGLARYTCAVCRHTYEKTIYLRTEIKTNPKVSSSTVYIGQTLSNVKLSGGEGSVSGSFDWTNKNEVITQSGYYSVTFTPTEKDVYETLTTKVYVTATQLTVTITAGANGKANPNGVVKVNYNDSLTVSFSPNNGYEIGKIKVGDTEIAACESYTINNIVSNKTVSVTFNEIIVENPKDDPDTENRSFTITCESGTPNCYTYNGTTIYFTTISAESSYSISGTLNGNIVIDVGDDYKFDLEFKGFTLSCSTTNPITILSGDEVSLKAKNGYSNYIYDKRAAIDSSNETLYSAAIISLVDLEIAGKGSLTVVSDNNNGIHTKDDLQIKNLTLSVTCQDNALKGNDGVEIVDANTTLIAKGGDCIKSTNSHINTTTKKQKGTISISGGTHNLYAACDGIDAAYNVVIDSDSTVLNIFTDKYSEYSETVTVAPTNTYYLRYNSKSYKYSIRYYNSSTGASEWVNVSTDYQTVSSQGGGGRPGGSSSSTYYYYTFTKLSGYDKFVVYMYSSGQTQGQASSYYACSSQMTINDSYDTVALSYRNNSLSVSWTNYSTSSRPGGGMGGGMQEGNSDKGEYSTKAIKAANEITINGGKINVKSYDDAVHANNDGGTLENGANPTGNLTINGGIITIYTNDDGLHADGTVKVIGGTVNITNAYEGVEGQYIKISGGSVSVNSKDDGFNGTATTGAAIEISGGYVYINCTGDGIDSNSRTSKGAIIFSGGNTVIISNSNGNSSIDSDGGYTHSGGRVLAIMPNGGMTGETTNGNTLGMTKASSVSLSANGYANVTVSGKVVAAVKMPIGINAFVVYLGSSGASISASNSNSNTLDANGVYWS